VQMSTQVAKQSTTFSNASRTEDGAHVDASGAIRTEMVENVALKNVGHGAVRAVLVSAVVAAGTLHDGAIVHEVNFTARVLEAEETARDGRDRVWEAAQYRGRGRWTVCIPWS
jgi:hypothetical protein